MHGCGSDNEQLVDYSDMIVADLMEPIAGESEVQSFCILFICFSFMISQFK